MSHDMLARVCANQTLIMSGESLGAVDHTESLCWKIHAEIAVKSRKIEFSSEAEELGVGWPV